MRLSLALMVTVAVLTAGCGSSSVRESTHRSRAPATEARPAGGPGEYVVQRGDTLYSIAFRNQLDYHDLADWNGIGRGYTIYPGRVLRLTAPGSTALPPPAREVQTAPIPLGPPPQSGSPPPVAMASAPPQRYPTPPAAPTVPALPPDTAPRPAIPSSAPVASPADGDVSGPRFDAGHWEWPTHGKVARGFAADGSSKGVDIAGELGQIVVAA
ncbi:MAG: LysM peptidoglycan-binding domain-containing protein, partial [Nevskia sp.]|nr:LysM peptidoglycan-binding domain-containing protein [Nevskia sp.]